MRSRGFEHYIIRDWSYRCTGIVLDHVTPCSPDCDSFGQIKGLKHVIEGEYVAGRFYSILTSHSRLVARRTGKSFRGLTNCVGTHQDCKVTFGRFLGTGAHFEMKIFCQFLKKNLWLPGFYHF